jgi:hypothetical protein
MSIILHHTVTPVNKNNNSIIIPAPPTANPGYASEVFCKVIFTLSI